MDVSWFLLSFCYASKRIIKAYDDYSVKKSKRSGPEEKLLSPQSSLSNILSLWIYLKFYEQSVSTHLMPFVSLPQLGFLLFLSLSSIQGKIDISPAKKENETSSHPLWKVFPLFGRRVRDAIRETSSSFLNASQPSYAIWNKRVENKNLIPLVLAVDRDQEEEKANK
jgi:hypothetical protein